MTIEYHPSFKKSFKKRILFYPKLVTRTHERIALFRKDSKSPLLKDHQLTGKKAHLRAFWVTGDIRIVYLPVSVDQVMFLDIGTHNQVY